MKQHDRKYEIQLIAEELAHIRYKKELEDLTDEQQDKLWIEAEIEHEERLMEAVMMNQ